MVAAGNDGRCGQQLGQQPHGTGRVYHILSGDLVAGHAVIQRAAKEHVQRLHPTADTQDRPPSLCKPGNELILLHREGVAKNIPAAGQQQSLRRRVLLCAHHRLHTGSRQRAAVIVAAPLYAVHQHRGSPLHLRTTSPPIPCGRRGKYVCGAKEKSACPRQTLFVIGNYSAG